MWRQKASSVYDLSSDACIQSEHSSAQRQVVLGRRAKWLATVKAFSTGMASIQRLSRLQSCYIADLQFVML